MHLPQGPPATPHRVEDRAATDRTGHDRGGHQLTAEDGDGEDRAVAAIEAAIDRLRTGTDPAVNGWRAAARRWRSRLEGVMPARRRRDPPGSTGLLVLVVLVVPLVAVLLGGAFFWWRSSVVARDQPPAVERAARDAGTGQSDGIQPGGTGAAPVRGSAATTARRFLVHVAGAVVHPGLYEVTPGARVADAVSAAGGYAVDADRDRVNLAAGVSDGQRVYLPRLGEPSIPDVVSASPAAPTSIDQASPGAGESTTVPHGPIDINTASVAELDVLPGIGPSLAAAIIEYRNRHGPFRSIEQLSEVPGIGEGRLRELRGRVSVGGS